MDHKQLPSLPILLHFAPERWGTIERFIRFHRTTHAFDRHVGRRLSGILGNSEKTSRLLTVIRDLMPKLEEDEQHLRDNGFSAASRSREIGAVVEAAFCSLYSTLDCFRVVFGAVFINHCGVKASTRGTFQNGHNGKLDEGIPEPIREQFRLSKTWFDELRKLRDEMTHSDVGSCHRNRETGSLSYIHSGLGTAHRALVIEDVVAKIEWFRETINTFLGNVFQILNEALKDETTEQFCGIFNARLYQRYVKPSEATNFHGGRCKSMEWFDINGNPICPLRDRCGAYTRAKSTNGVEIGE
jgi:hypothetical protein